MKSRGGLGGIVERYQAWPTSSLCGMHHRYYHKDKMFRCRPTLIQSASGHLLGREVPFTSKGSSPEEADERETAVMLESLGLCTWSPGLRIFISPFLTPTLLRICTKVLPEGPATPS